MRNWLDDMHDSLTTSSPSPHPSHARDTLTQNKRGDTPLILSCREGHINCVAELLSSGATVNNMHNSRGLTAVHVCAEVCVVINVLLNVGNQT